MKRKFLSILTIILSVILLICALSFSASAEDSTVTPMVSIDKFNLVFEDNVYLKYAVKFDGVEDGSINSNNIGMLYFTAPQNEYIQGNERYSSSVVGYTTINGQKYYTFEYRHITAKQMTDYIYSVAYIDINGERYYSAPNKFSVLEYCYYKLGKTGVASDNEDYRNLLTATLEQGAMAQKYFKYNDDRLANDEYYLVEVVGGTLEDGFTKGFYHNGETATLTAPETNGESTIKGWKNSTDNPISTDNQFVLSSFTKNETYIAYYYETIYSEGLKFTSNGDGTCYISGIGTCTDTCLIIPPVSPDENIVTAIGDDAFEGCYNLTNVTIPNSVISIGEWAFDGCSRLTSITIGNNVTSIGTGAFYSCTSLTSVHITNTATWCNILFDNYSSNPLYYAKNLYINKNLVTELIIPENVKAIGNYAFYNCSAIKSLVIDNNVTTIGTNAFNNCDSLTSVVMGDSVTSIGDYAFYDCDILANTVIGDSVASIGYNAFSDCDSLKSIVIPKSVIYISDGVFRGCDILESVVFEETSIWYRTTKSDYSGGSQMDVTDSADNANTLANNYAYNYWYKQ